MTRTGKIARLPRPIREELNQRLANGEAGSPLLAWLNAHDDVRAILTTHFASRAISEQNLSDWRQGGFEDWLRYQDAQVWLRDLAEKSGDLDQLTDGEVVTNWLSAPLALALGRCIHRIADEAPTNFEDRKNLIVLARELSNLRRGDHQQQSLRFQRQRWEAAHANPEPPKTPKTRAKTG